MTRLVHLLALLALALGLSACGGGEVAADPVAEAAAKTRDAGSSRIDLRVAVAAPGRRMAFGAKGAFDYRRGRGTLSYDLSALDAGRGEIRFDRKVVYLRMPQLQTMLPEGKSWLKLDVEESARGAGVTPLDQLGPAKDPTQVLDVLRSLDATPTVVGRERVRGVQTTHYRARVSLADALAQGLKEMPDAKRRPTQEQLRTMIETTGLDTIPVDVWVDPAQRLRRLKASASLRLPAEAGGATTAVAMTMDFFDFGVRVDVKPPPSASTFDATRLVQAGAAG